MSIRKASPDPETLLAALPLALQGLARRGVPRGVRKGAVIIEEGELGDTLYIVLSGRLRAYSSNLEQDREVTHGIFGPGQTVGEFSLDGRARAASVEALEPCVCMVVTRQTLRDHLHQHPEFALQLLNEVIGRVRLATASVSQLALNTVYGRLKQYFESCGPCPPDGWLAVGRVRHGEIAARIGCSRPMVSRLLQDLTRAGHVASDADGLRVRLPLPARW